MRSSRNASDLPLLQRYFSVITRYATFAGAALMAYFLFETRQVILLVSKPEYLEAAAAFRWYGIWMPVVFIQLIVANLLVCLDEERRLMSRYLFSVAVNTVLSLLLIPWLGVSGAASALVLSEIIAMIYGLVLVHGRGIRLPISVFAETLSVVLVVWLCSLLPLLPVYRILFGFAALGAIVLGTFALRDRHILARILRSER